MKTPTLALFSNPDIRRATYVLAIHLKESSVIQIGTRTDKKIAFPAGYYVYIGSAMGRKGSSSIQNRLIRHATRRNGKHQGILGLLRKQLFISTQLKSPTIPAQYSKKLHWHIDFFLENHNTSIKKIYVIFTSQPLEEKLSLFLNSHNAFAPIEKGLGASDMKYPLTNLLHANSALEKIDRIIMDFARKYVMAEFFIHNPLTLPNNSQPFLKIQTWIDNRADANYPH